MLIDTHTHLNFQAFKEDAPEVIERSLADKIWVINVGSQLETSRRAVELAEKYSEGVYAAIGFHPIHVTGEMLKNKLDPEELAVQEKISEFNIDDYRKLALGPRGRRVVAIGEIGLDYYYKPKTKIRLEEFKNRQKQVLLEQMNLAKELDLPIAFHCRSAHGDLIEILNTKYKILDTKSELRGVIHCFTGSIEQMQRYLDLGLYLGFNGIVFKSIPGIDWQEIITKAPLEKILVETDAPYLTPPEAGQERNEPLFMKYVVQEIAKIKQVSYQEVSEITTQNARELFSI